VADTFNDPEFGTFYYDTVFWKLSYPKSLNGVDVTVYFNADTDEVPEISPVERLALRQVFSLLPETLQKATPLVVQNYEEIYNLIEEQDPEYLEYLPKIENPSEIWQFVELDDFLVEKHGDITIPTFFLNAECEWEEEHGLMLRFRNGVVDAVGQAGDLGMKD
jgi:hypothetical protein